MRTGGVFTLLSLLFVSTASWVVYAEHLHADVIIVGAGLAGMAAGNVLSENGVNDILFLEATGEIGGRLRTQAFGGYNLQVGADWMEGLNGDAETNPIYPIAQEVNLVMSSPVATANVTNNIYDKTGYVQPEPVEKQNERYHANLCEMALSTSLQKHEEADISVLTAQRLFKREPETPVEVLIDYTFNDARFGEHPRTTSLKNTQPVPTYGNFGPDLYYIADQRGYTAMFEPFVTYLKKDNGSILDSRLRFNKVVIKIVYSASGVELFTEDGSSYSANLAILTVSLGVLQSPLISFEPQLPLWKLEALYKLDMSVYIKVHFKFNETFWPSGPGTSFMAYADETRRGYYPVWQHLSHEFPGSNIIMVILVGDEARRIETQPDEQTQKEGMEVLRYMFGPHIPDPEEFMVGRWWNDRLFRGSFSNWPVGVTPRTFKDLRAPLGRLYFSGEHTNTHYNGFVHGGYLSGVESAKMALDCLQKKQCASGSEMTLLDNMISQPDCGLPKLSCSA